MSLSFIRRLTMPLPDLERYYREQRKKRFERGHQPKNIRLREWCYPIFRAFLAVDRQFRKQTITIINPPPKEKKFAQRLYPYDTLESVERTRYHTKEELEQRQAFAHLDKLIPCKENAFLLRKR